MMGLTPLNLDPDHRLELWRKLRRAADDAAGDTIQVEFVGSLHRNVDAAEAVEKAVPWIIDLYERDFIAGFAWVGGEWSYGLGPFRHANAQLHETGMGIEVHAGEFDGPESVWEALEYGFPDRIGHGLAIFQDPDLIRLFQERQIHVELCPTSNLRLGRVQRIEDHPLRKALDLGLNFSLNTDDPGIFQCTVESEYRLAADYFGFTAADLETVTANALHSRFRRYSEAKHDSTQAFAMEAPARR